MVATLTVDGLEGVMELFKIIESLPTEIKGVNLLPIARDDGKSNADILGWLKEQGRAFSDFGDQEGERLAQVAAKEYDKQLTNITKRLNKLTAAQASKGLSGNQQKSLAKMQAFQNGAGNKLAQQQANQISSSVFRAVMKEAMQIMTEHIENQTGPDGAALENPRLSEAYGELKEMMVGFAYPIGKRSGQLLDNLNPSVKGQIKVTKY